MNKLKKILLVGMVVLFVGLLVTTDGPELPQINTEVVSVSPVVQLDKTVSSKKINIRHLDLAKANLTYLTTAVSGGSVDRVINDINTFNLQKTNKPIYLILDSPGGSVIDGGRLISTIEASRNRVVAINIGMCASMCFIILEHSHERLALNRATLMGHPASISGMMQGELDKIHSRLSYLKRYVDKLDHFIAARAGMTPDQFKLLTTTELWIDSADAMESKLLDGIVSVSLPQASELNLGSNTLRDKFKLQ